MFSQSTMLGTTSYFVKMPEVGYIWVDYEHLCSNAGLISILAAEKSIFMADFSKNGQTVSPTFFIQTQILKGRLRDGA